MHKTDTRRRKRVVRMVYEICAFRRCRPAKGEATIGVTDPAARHH